MKVKKIIMLLFLYNAFLYGNAADQIESNNETIDIQTQKIEEDNALQEKDIRIRYLITVFQLNLIFLEKILNVIEINRHE
jgi:p-aminobenzoyl-glutamate transporter AbgT